MLIDSIIFLYLDSYLCLSFAIEDYMIGYLGIALSF